MDPIDKEGRTIALVSYITVFGTLIAFLMNVKKKDAFASFHIRQMVGLVFLQFILETINAIISLGYFYFGFVLLFFICWLIGFIRAINYSTNPIPLIGAFIQQYLKNLQ